MMQIYFKNSFISLYYDKKARLGKAEWRGHLRGSELREAFLLCLELIDRFNLTGWLADDRLMQSIAPADLKWSMDVFVPRMANNQLQRMAYLPSYSEENRTAVETMIDNGQTYGTSMVVRHFDNEQEAMAWLTEPR